MPYCHVIQRTFSYNERNYQKCNYENAITELCNQNILRYQFEYNHSWNEPREIPTLEHHRMYDGGEGRREGGKEGHMVKLEDLPFRDHRKLSFLELANFIFQV